MFKAFVNLFCAAALVNAVLAQEIFIASPEPNSDVTAGSEIVVQLGKVVSSTGSMEVAVALGATPCIPGCPDVSEDLGDSLYIGPYNPQPHADAHYPYQNITVTIPSSYTGPMQLGALHCYLLGAGNTPQRQLMSMPLNVVASH